MFAVKTLRSLRFAVGPSVAKAYAIEPMTAAATRFPQFSASTYVVCASTPAPSSTRAPLPTTPPQSGPKKPATSNPLKSEAVSGSDLGEGKGEGFYLEDDAATSFEGISAQPFPKEALDILNAPINPDDVEIKPDGMLYLPEIKYRRILNRAFGPGGWGVVPRGPHMITNRNVSREYALFCLGRFVSQARGEQDYFGSEDSLPTATEGCKSNALMRCCKDLGIAWELWDPVFIRSFKKEHCAQVWAVNVGNQGKKLVWKRKERELDYPFKEEARK
ncbi:mitochondrial genome maintenance protein MGM101, mitochondrial precursor [Cladochytrium replicatum]|nr:mitochondrial genome maintenance protein MGM101, mitochondrial precursor [Cladochytrium replicatum]